MENYTYTGCVTTVQAEGSGLPAVLLPNATVTADPNHPYVKRLVARGLLVKKSQPLNNGSTMCIPSRTDFDTSINMSIADQFASSTSIVIAAIHDDLGNEDYFVGHFSANIAMSPYSKMYYFDNYAISPRIQTNTGNILGFYKTFLGKVLYLGPNYNFNGINKNLVQLYQTYVAQMNGGTQFATQQDLLVYLNDEAQKMGLTMSDISASFEYFMQLENAAAQNQWNLTWVDKPTNVTITKPSAALLDRIRQENNNFRVYSAAPYNYPVINFTDIFNGGKDIVVHSCMYADITFKE